MGLISERKQLLYRIEQRAKAVERLVAGALVQDSKSRIIIFHENIAEVMRIFDALREAGYAVVAEHSELPEKIRARAIQLFREGTAQIIVSAKSLVEGFNVPSADIGIVVASSTSVRQRIQTLGRLLRKTDAAKQARLIVLFAERTVDEMIYEKADWNGFVGADRNEYFRWSNVEQANPIRVSGAPRAYVPSDSELDAESLLIGGRYPGKLEGEIFTVDTSGTVFDSSRRPVPLESEVLAQLREFKGGGRIVITPRRFHVVRMPRTSSDGEPVYLGRLLELPKAASTECNKLEFELVPGGEYPIARASGQNFSVLQRDARLIARKEKGRVRFVPPLSNIFNPEKRTRLEKIQAEVRNAYRKGHQISKVFVNDLGHVGYLHQGRAYFLGYAPDGPSGFTLEEF